MNRFVTACVGAFVLAAIVYAQSPAIQRPDPRSIRLRGDRFKPLAYDEMLATKQVSDATFAAVKNVFGERGVVDLVAVIGWYNTVSMLLNVDRYPVAENTQPELKPLK